MQTKEQYTRSLELFRSLIKDGCEWHGDVMSRQWSECLYIHNDSVLDRVERTLTVFEDVEHRLSGFEIWIA